MAFKTWQTGVHIQQDRVLIVALDRDKSGWRLRRWWAIPLGEGIIRDGKICQPEQLVDALRDWRKTLPHAHRVFLSFPAARTLQRSLPRPTVALRDSEQLSWLGSALARELEMSADTLCFDYAQDTFSNTFQVTAAQNNEVNTLLALAKTLRLRLVTITPDASALTNLLSAVAPARRYNQPRIPAAEHGSVPGFPTDHVGNQTARCHPDQAPAAPPARPRFLLR